MRSKTTLSCSLTLVMLLVFPSAAEETPLQMAASVASPAAPAKASRQRLNIGTPKQPKKSQSQKTRKRLPPATAQIVSVRKNVDLKSAGQDSWKKAQQNSVVKGDDKIRTGSRSVARVKMQDGSTVLLLQNSEAEMENLSDVKKAIKLLRGKVRAVVKSIQGANAFQIKTPIGVASVRGTEFMVEYQEESKSMAVDVLQGEVGVSKLGEELSREVIVTPGERVLFGAEGEIGDPIQSGALPIEANDVRVEFYNDQVKQDVIAMAAEESRNADYQVGKTLMDVDGKRVRVEEYIMRPASNQFKLVSLNERDNRFDYFTYKGTFNTTLPDDLSLALKEVGGKLGDDAPDYYLTEYEMFMSNTRDNIEEVADEGHRVKITLNNDDTYTLVDHDGAGQREEIINVAELQSDGSYSVYDPLRDVYRSVTADNLEEAKKISVLDSVSGEYRNLEADDVYWKTRFNNTTYSINDTIKTAFTKKNSVTDNIVAVDLDANFSNAPITTISEYPSGTDKLHNRLSLFYSDGSKTTYDNYIIDDEGQVGTTDVFSGISTSAQYQNELVKWNYQQKISSTEMSDEINLVIDPRIGTISGLIK